MRKTELGGLRRCGTNVAGDDKVKIESTTVGTSGELSKSTTEARGDLGGMPFLGVTSIKKIANGCR
jgi:hypothetical protein